jgi:hypothetical protein
MLEFIRSSAGPQEETGVTPGMVWPPPPTPPVALNASQTLPSAGTGGEPAAIASALDRISRKMLPFSKGARSSRRPGPDLERSGCV